MERWSGRVALVTGASAGIGAAVAYQLQDHGVHVVAVARRVEKIEEAVAKARQDAKSRGRYHETKAKPGKLYAKKCDLAKEEDILAVFKWIKETLGGVDILVNNAALEKESGITDAPTEDWRIVVDVNILGLSICTREAVQNMRGRGVDDGHIIHIGSVAGHNVGLHNSTMYAATKHAVLALTEGLRKDFLEHKSNMKVSCVTPGVVKTEFRDKLPYLKNIFDKKVGLYSEDVAEAVLYVLGTPPHVQGEAGLLDGDAVSQARRVLTVKEMNGEDRECVYLTDNMERWSGRVALVTGASAGIGAAVAYHLQDHGVHVVAVARRVDKIEEAVAKAKQEAKSRGRYHETKAKPGKLYAKKCDLAKEEDILAVFKWIKETLGGVDILINNAAIAKESGLTDAPTEDWRIVLDVNILGLSICTREAVQNMRARGVDDGHIIHISSVNGHKVVRHNSAMYAATKHAVMALTEGLRKDFVEHKSNMKISCVSPGVVKTEFRDNLPNYAVQFGKMPGLYAEDLADAVLYALGTPPHVQIHEILIKPVGEAF
ncbi:uncharacterized protein [Anabrus simplex]|uniref:uncharacterized protein n=1 Tax=Anabrus simplex TaxID=316456 RepID=UPI0035A31074